VVAVVAQERNGKELASMCAIESRTGEIAGLGVRWLQAPCPDPPILWVHGVPDSAELWTPFLERAGGIAVDLPGFGASAKPAEWPYSLGGYERFLAAFLDHLGLDRVRLVVHDWGAVALTLGARIERLVALDVLPLLPGHRWPVVARAWRTPVLGELVMGFTGGFALQRVGGLSRDHADAVMRHFDHGTQRAILKLFRATTAATLADAAPALAAVRGPALVLWGGRDRYLAPAWAERVAGALGGEAVAETVPGAGHWPWLDRPEVATRAVTFLQSDRPSSGSGG
jgi:pimeloyl-ACP methyl ester carboxylesterase